MWCGAVYAMKHDILGYGNEVIPAKAGIQKKLKESSGSLPSRGRRKNQRLAAFEKYILNHVRFV